VLDLAFFCFKKNIWLMLVVSSAFINSTKNLLWGFELVTFLGLKNCLFAVFLYEILILS